MSRADDLPVAVMTVDDTMDQAKDMVLATAEVAGSGGSENTMSTCAPMTLLDVKVEDETTGLVPSEVVVLGESADTKSTCALMIFLAIKPEDVKTEDETTGLVPSEAAVSESVETEHAYEPDIVHPILVKAESIGLKDMDVPKTANGILTFPFYPELGRHEPQTIVGRSIVQLMKPRNLTTRELQVMFNILKSLSQIEVFTRAAEERLQIKFMLTAFLGVWPKASRPYEFPEVFQNAAASILTKVEEDLGAEEVIEEIPPTLTSPPLPTSKRKKRTMEAVAASLCGSKLHESPRFNDPTVQGIMHNLIPTDGLRRVYRLLDKSTTRSCNVFGHNGLTVGQWWPYRICALRDGAHGAMQGGIAGTARSGAYSVVVSGEYSELDRDEKDILYYSGSDSNTNIDPVNPIVTHNTKALRQSYRDARPIRVLRTSTGRAAHCPSKGIRYDGLYRIISEGYERNRNGGAYVRFVLVREGKQADIDLNRPTQKERNIYDQLKASF